MANCGVQLTKILTQTDVDKTLTVPPEWLPALSKPPTENVYNSTARLTFVDKLGFFWEFWMAFVPTEYLLNGRGALMAVLEPKEWFDFVLWKELKAGNRIVVDTKGGCEFRRIKFRLIAQKLDCDGVTWIDL